jgi:3-oxoacyl-[acyl-carrier-protein] synthase-3
MFCNRELAKGDRRIVRRAKITALGTYTPPKLLTNQDLEKMVDTTNEWILERTGISERHIVEEGKATSDLAVEAAKIALANRGVDASTVDLIILATVTPDMFFPSTACLVQDRIGAKGAWGFDILAACSGFVYALTTGAQFIATGAAKRVLVIGSDSMSRIIDYTDRATCVLFGDGAGAVLLEPAEDGESEGLIDYLNEIDGSGGQFLYMPGGGSLHPSTEETVKKRMHFVHQDGRQVFKYATRKMYEASVQLLQRNGLTVSDVDVVLPHQANKRIITASTERMGIDPAKVMINIGKFGNTTAGTIPLAMRDAMDQGLLKKGSLALLCAVGAGFTVGTALVRWGLD